MWIVYVHYHKDIGRKRFMQNVKKDLQHQTPKRSTTPRIMGFKYDIVYMIEMTFTLKLKE